MGCSPHVLHCNINIALMHWVEKIHNFYRCGLRRALWRLVIVNGRSFSNHLFVQLVCVYNPYVAMCRYYKKKSYASTPSNIHHKNPST